MPIVAGNQPEPKKPTRGPSLGWLVPLLVFGPPLYSFVRRVTAGILTNQQLLVVGGGVLGLIVLGVIVQRVNRLRAGGASRLPTSYAPPAPTLPGASSPGASGKTNDRAGQPYLPPPPRFEPIVTGNVLLVGVLVALVMGLIGFVLLG